MGSVRGGGADPIGAAFDRACRAYDKTARALNRALAGLQRQAGLGAEPAEELLKAIRAHQKAIDAVVSYESRLFRRRAHTAGGGKLDLTAARAEVLGRLARLAAAAGA